MQQSSNIICTTCPVGCSLQVTHDVGQICQIEGNACKRGLDYARSELQDPRRMVTTTVRVRGGTQPLLPVHTARPFPKPAIFALLSALRQLEVAAPLHIGQPVLANALGSGIDVLASRDLPARLEHPDT